MGRGKVVRGLPSQVRDGREAKREVHYQAVMKWREEKYKAGGWGQVTGPM